VVVTDTEVKNVMINVKQKKLYSGNQLKTDEDEDYEDDKDDKDDYDDERLTQS
jgi:hypothetical protein